MLIVAALSGFLTFMVTLWILNHNFNRRMLLIEDKSQSVSNKVTNGILFYSGKSLDTIGFPYEEYQAKIAILQSHLDMFSYKINIMGETFVNKMYDIGTEIQSPEYFYDLFTSLEPVMHTAILFSSYAVEIGSNITVYHVEWWWIYGIFVSLCFLFVLLSQRKALLSCTEDSETEQISEVASNNLSRIMSEDYSNDKTAQVVPQIPETSRGERDVDVIKEVYKKVFTALEESSYLSKKPHCMSRYTVTDTPMLSDIMEMIEPLSEFINEGIHNTTMLSQEYLNQNDKLLRTEDSLRSIEKQRRAQEILSVISQKDIRIVELKILIDKLEIEVNSHFDNITRLSLQLTILRKKMEKQGEINDNILHVYDVKLKEAKSVEEFVGDELQVEADLNKSLKEAYTKNMRILLRILIGSSKIGAVSFQSIERFLSSNQFEEFLKTGALPTELESHSVFNGFPQLANAYEEHLNVLKDCF